MGMLGLCFLANLCNSTVIEIHGDKIRVSHGFEYCQSLGFIAESTTSALKTRIDDIADFEWQFIFLTTLCICSPPFLSTFFCENKCLE